MGSFVGGPDEMGSELIDPSGNTIIIKQEYCNKDDDDFVDVNGPFLCIKKEKDDIDHPIVLCSEVDTTQIFEVKPLDAEIGGEVVGSNPDLLVVWQEREPFTERSRECLWMRSKDPQCEVWSCKMSATYGHSTGPSRCSQHREAWMVMFEHCVVEGCMRFGVVVSSEDEPVRCETHAAEDICRVGKQLSRPLEHLVDDNGADQAGLDLGLGLGEECRVHEVAAVRQQVVDSGAVEGECSGNVQDAQGGTETWAVPCNNNHSSPQESNGATPVPVEVEISRLKEEYEDLRQKMVKIEIELARLQGVHNRESQVIEAPVKKPVQPRGGRHSAPLQESSASKVVAANDGKNGANNAPGKISLDGYNWRKYGEIALPGMVRPRVFYGCTNIGCIARKIEERTTEGHVRHFYEGVHNHPQPGKTLPRPVAIPHWKRRKRHHSMCTD